MPIICPSSKSKRRGSVLAGNGEVVQRRRISCKASPKITSITLKVLTNLDGLNILRLSMIVYHCLPEMRCLKPPLRMHWIRVKWRGGASSWPLHNHHNHQPSKSENLMILPVNFEDMDGVPPGPSALESPVAHIPRNLRHQNWVTRCHTDQASRMKFDQIELCLWPGSSIS